MTNKLKMWTNDGVCLLCGKKAGKMSKDHIPPQCCGNNGAFRVRAYSENSNYNEEIFNKGVYYSTLCQTCNEFLGIITIMFGESLQRILQERWKRPYTILFMEENYTLTPTL
jgi:hypothetical protein